MQHTDFKSMPSQIICLAGSIRFTQQAEQAIETGQLSNLQVRRVLLEVGVIQRTVPAHFMQMPAASDAGLHAVCSQSEHAVTCLHWQQ